MTPRHIQGGGGGSISSDLMNLSLSLTDTCQIHEYKKCFQKTWSAGPADMQHEYACAINANKTVSCKSGYAKVPADLGKVLRVTTGSSESLYAAQSMDVYLFVGFGWCG